ATPRGSLSGTPPTGKHVSVDGVHIVRIADGKVIEHWGNNDDLGLMRQLGVIPEPAAVSRPRGRERCRAAGRAARHRSGMILARPSPGTTGRGRAKLSSLADRPRAR